MRNAKFSIRKFRSIAHVPLLNFVAGWDVKVRSKSACRGNCAHVAATVMVAGPEVRRKDLTVGTGPRLGTLRPFRGNGRHIQPIREISAVVFRRRVKCMKCL